MLAESLRILTDKIDSFTKPIVEAKGHIDHPEDLLFLDRSTGAKRAVDAMEKTVKNPNLVTIKWDGYPALLFGTGLDKKFTVLDKHMMDKLDGSGRRIYSPQQFVQYDKTRGAERPELSQIINEIWPGLQKSYSGAGWYWGDLLFKQPLQPERDGLYHFRANPKGIHYTVDPSSEIGKLLKGKQAGIVVHGYLDPDAPEKAEQMSTPEEKVYPTELVKPLNGTIGNLKNNSNVAILPAKMPITPNLTLDKNLYNTVSSSIASNGRRIDEFFKNAPKAKTRSGGEGETPLPGLLLMYINQRVRKRNLKNLTSGFPTFVANRAQEGKLTKQMAAELLGYTDPQTNEYVPGYLESNMDGLEDVFQVWIDIYNLKMNILKQLNKAAETAPVQGYLQTGKKSQEGFVSQGLKFIDRMGFSAQNLAGRA